MASKQRRLAIERNVAFLTPFAELQKDLLLATLSAQPIGEQKIVMPKGTDLGLVAALAATLLISGSIPSASTAQSYANYCHERAQKLSGYRGRPGGALGGAVEGAIGGAIIGGILGGNKKERRKAAQIGAIIGGISRSNRPNSRAARIYRLEYEECMRRR